MVQLLFTRKRPGFISKIKSRRGSYTAEAAVCILAFACAFMAFLSLARAAKAQKTVQTALDKTAAEVSGYCHTAALVADRLEELVQEKKESAEGGLETLLSFSDGAFSLLRGNAESADASEIITDLLENGVDGLKSGSGISEAVTDALLQYGDTPEGACAAIALLLFNNEAEEELPHILAAPVCRGLIEKYISEDDASLYLEKCGIEGGLDGLDFRLSSLLPDGSSIKLAAAYHIDIINLGPFSIGYDTVCVSCTGSWCDGAEGADTGVSVWSLGNFARGQKITAEMKAGNSAYAVKSGYGFDLYDYNTGVYTLIVSLNPFTKTYSSYTGDGTEVSDYSFKSSEIYKELKGDAATLVKHADKAALAGTVEGADGVIRATGILPARYRLIVVMPEEAAAFDEDISEIEAKIEKNTGAAVTVRYSEKYF